MSDKVVKLKLAVLLVASLLQVAAAEDGSIFDFMGEIQTIMKSPESLNPIDRFLLDILPIIVGQSPNNINGTMSEFEEYVMNDDSNDDAAGLSGQELIVRSGFKYDLYEAIADDGYVTQLTRIINPLADRKSLRWPPVLMEHGGTIDPTAYLIASSIQHHPEKWPRSPQDGPITSWNRSLAFTLANHGFDVWLAETRGSSDKNQKHVQSKAAKSIAKGENRDKNMTEAESMYEASHQHDFWDFSQDDIIAHELKSHMDTVLALTNSTKLSLMTFSLSTPTSLSFFSIRPDYAEKVQGYICMAPIIAGFHINKLLQAILHGICPILPDSVGTLILSDFLLTEPIRKLFMMVSRFRYLRYSLVKAVVSLLMGPSAKYQTLLDLNVMGHLLRRLSFKEAKQLCQQTKANKLQKFDYGPDKNMLLYNSTEPPIYDLSNLLIKDWIIVSSINDALSTPENVQHLIDLVNPKPLAHIAIPAFNHLDLIAGFGNDIKVNLPILKYLQSMSVVPELDPMAASGARMLDFKTLIPSSFSAEGIAETAKNITENLTNPIGLMGMFQDGLTRVFQDVGQMFDKIGRGQDANEVARGKNKY